MSATAIGVGPLLAPTVPAAATGRPQGAASPVGGPRLGRSGVQADPLAGAPALPSELTALAWLVADATTGDVLAAQNAHLPLPPASTLKMLFADTLLPKFDRSLVHRVTTADLAGIGEGSSLVGVKEGLGYQVQDLWRGVFLSSGNDAVHVLARMNGGIARTVTQMQARAEALQALDTHVVTPDGYDEDGQVSSAYDLTLFARAGLRDPDFRSYCATRTADFPGAVDLATGVRSSYAIANTDKLLGSYPGLIGVKNGYTTNAGATFTGAAVRDGRTLLVTVMHPESSGTVYDEAALLLDWGFAAAGRVRPVGVLAPDGAQPAAAEPDGLPRATPLPADDDGIGAAWWAAGAAAGTAVVLAGAAAVTGRGGRRPAAGPAAAGAGAGAGPRRSRRKPVRQPVRRAVHRLVGRTRRRLRTR
ncbi:D-alanyl-D-alanine carboxypeptidase family protein [Kitasatospora sp. NE20-6]|uniref:D-alanyl-D-alanine carboxypeptidase family protein n=1 Tax=Kitasatospora sp. NE20-6 TaxID=2859066 RepID=UPI0038B340FB